MNTLIENLLNSNRLIEDICSTSSLMETKISNLKHEFSIQETEKLQELIDEKLNQDRLLNIGIVGRVKAGKSSLLNALFFDGDKILPSAATPMTAALTTLTYGDSFSAKVNFYSSNDIQNIKEKADEYEELFESEVNKLTKKQIEKKREITEELKQTISKRARRQLKDNIVLASAHEQYQQMKESKKLNQLEENREIVSSNREELAKQLLEFVSAKGQFMPVTKSVDISLPIESLKDIMVIDTPGFNDPVQSREARTVELLKQCDAIFIVSPAGQFLSNEDLNMMGRITDKQGIRELSIVASQVDMQFYGSEKKDSVSDTLVSMSSKLSSHMTSVLSNFKQKTPMVGTTFDSLINNSNEEEGFLYTSGMCHAISKKIKAGQSLTDEGEKHTWSLLKAAFPDYFSDDDSSLSIKNLNEIANISKITEKLDKVREEKDKIINQIVKDYLSSQQKNLNDFKDKLVSSAKEEINTIKNGSIESIQQEIQVTKSKKKKIEYRIDDTYDELKNKLKDNIHEKLNEVLKQKYQQLDKNIIDNTDETQERKTRDKSGFGNWFGRKIGWWGTEEYSEGLTKIHSAQLVHEVDYFIEDIQSRIELVAEENNRLFVKEIKEGVVKNYRNAINEGEEDSNKDKLVDEDLVIDVIKDITNKELCEIPPPKKIKLPSELRGRGILTGRAADDFLEELDKHMQSFRNTFKTEIRNYNKQVMNNLPKDISKKFTEQLQKEIEKKEKNKRNQVINIERLEMFEEKILQVNI